MKNKFKNGDVVRGRDRVKLMVVSYEGVKSNNNSEEKKVTCFYVSSEGISRMRIPENALELFNYKKDSVREQYPEFKNMPEKIEKYTVAKHGDEIMFKGAPDIRGRLSGTCKGKVILITGRNIQFINTDFVPAYCFLKIL